MEETKKLKGFGGRGWLLIIVLFLAFLTYSVFSLYPLTILAEDFLGGAQIIAVLMTVGVIIGLVIQLLFSRVIGRIKSIKRIAMIFGIAALVIIWAETLLAQNLTTNPGLTTPFYVVYLLENVTTTVYGLFFLSLIAGQWFPRRKGTVMGISTIAFPFCNGVIGLFATSVYKPFESGIFIPNIFRSFLPFLIACTIGVIMFITLVTDYPEQVGAYRDNDRSFTPEMAKAMLEQEIEDKKTTVWNLKHIFATRDYWFAAIACGLLLMCAVGVSTQSSAIIGCFPNLNYTIIMIIVAIFGAAGSYLFGVLDTQAGTKTAITVSMVFMVISGILGLIATRTAVGVFLVIALMLLGMFQGASSNFTVSVCVQYWRREDFQGVYACVNPLANIFNALASTITATLLYSGINGSLNLMAVFLMVVIAGVVGFVLILAFRGSHVKAKDDKYRAEAGKPLDDALAARK